jgi:hypothetical protein
VLVLVTGNSTHLWVGGEFTKTGNHKSINQQGFAQSPSPELDDQRRLGATPRHMKPGHMIA